MKKNGIETDRSSFFQEPEGTPKSFIHTHSDYESDGEEAFPEVEVRVSIKKIENFSISLHTKYVWLKIDAWLLQFPVVETLQAETM